MSHLGANLSQFGSQIWHLWCTDISKYMYNPLLVLFYSSWETFVKQDFKQWPWTYYVSWWLSKGGKTLKTQEKIILKHVQLKSLSRPMFKFIQSIHVCIVIEDHAKLSFSSSFCLVAFWYQLYVLLLTNVLCYCICILQQHTWSLCIW